MKNIRIFKQFRLTTWTAIAASLLLCSCTNGKLGNLVKKISYGTANSQNGAISITRILRDNLNPTGSFEIMDGNSGAIGKYCSEKPDSSDSTATSCLCVFDYNITDPNNPSSTIPQRLQVNTTYVEADLLRCSFNQIPSSVTQVAASIYVTSASSLSNSITFDFLGDGTALDTSLISNFAQVYRYTCRDKVSVWNTMDLTSGIYDPIQSEDPKNSYPMSFYTSNIGSTFLTYAGGASGIAPPTGWDCPADPLNPPDDYRVTLYSQSPLGSSGGSHVISGATSGSSRDMNAPNARSTFYLSKSSTGIFNIPVDSYIAPNIVSSSSSSAAANGGAPTLGFGASPISTSSLGTERCPDSSVAIPAGYQWVKVWLFRMALPTRQSVSGGNLQLLSDIGCNVGPIPLSSATAPNNWRVPDCYNSTYVTGSGTSAAGYASRFSAGTGMCFNITPGGSGSVGSDPFATGTDTWTPNNKDTQKYACGAPSQSPVADLLHSCPITGGVTYDDSPIVTPIDDLNNNGIRYEFLFVVTPTTVNTSDMSNTSSPVLAQYTPYRFRVDSDCGLDDPSSCDYTYSFRNYGLKLHDVRSNGDPPADNPNRAGVFPVCALQPTGLPQ